MRYLLTISFALVISLLNAQTLYIPGGAQLSAGPNAVISVGGSMQNEGLVDVQQSGGLNVGLDLVNDSIISLGENTTFTASSNVINNNNIFFGAGSMLSISGTLSNLGNMTLGEQSSAVIQSHLLNQGNMTFENQSSVLVGGDIENSGTLVYNEETQSVVNGNFVNEGNYANLGTVDIGGNWNNNGFVNTYNNILFTGSGDQIFTDNTSEVVVADMEVAASGNVTLDVDDMIVQGNLTFSNGVLSLEENSGFLVDLTDPNNTGEAYAIIGGNESSYFDGNLRVLANGNETLNFPLGNSGRYMPIELFELDTDGEDYILAARYASPSPVVPTPAEDVIGVSDSSLWIVNVETGVIDSARVFIDFADEDLSSFKNENQINADKIVPVIAYSDSLDGTFTTLGGTLENTDSLTYGMITSERRLPLTGNQAFLGIGRAPVVSPDLKVFAPDAFAPGDPRVENQTYRVFGEFISEQNFSLKIYGQFNNLLYETTSLAEANEAGWDGTFRGADQPRGTYFVIIEYDLNNTPDENPAGPDRAIRKAIYLVR